MGKVRLVYLHSMDPKMNMVIVKATYYNTGLGACGETHSDSDFIAAISHILFDAT